MLEYSNVLHLGTRTWDMLPAVFLKAGSFQLVVCVSRHVVGHAPQCFEGSPTARAYATHLDSGGKLEAHSELASDYDGLGVHWGIGHKKQRWEDCERSCVERT